MLCPTSPGLNIPLLFTLIQLKEATGKKEHELLGAYSGKGVATALSFIEAAQAET